MKPINETEHTFQQKLMRKAMIVQTYQDSRLQEEALKLIPVEELNIKATQKLSLVGDTNDIGLEDLLLSELLHWFRDSFFSWVDAPKCDTCSQMTVSMGKHLPPTESESKWLASTVEGFFCSKCQSVIRFPRYNHVEKLMQTRQGRCGEWANCFTFFCCAMQYDARLVFDWADHMWTEVYSTSRGQWLHCDPCEDAYDKPLMYEVGWKKKLSYVIAFSLSDVQDVTWRYTVHFGEVCKRRTLCREEFLEYVIWNLREKLQEHLSREERDRKQDIFFEELMCFLTPPQCDTSTFDGRTSGSLAWRLARGETNIPLEESAYVFKLCPDEIHDKYFLVKYSCARDKYIRLFRDRRIESEGWNSWVFNQQNIFRKVESDWKVVYLARTENSPIGSLTWKFDFEESGLVIETLKLDLCSKAFETGKIQCYLSPNCDRSEQLTYGTEELTPLRTEALKGCTGFLLTIELTEGTGRIAWQHSQLFRQALDSEAFPFEVEVFFSNQRDGSKDCKKEQVDP